MNSTFSLLLVFLARFFMPRHNAQIRLLKAQIHILRARIPAQRIILSPAEKTELLRIGAECEHDIDGLMEVARPATYKRWLAQIRSGRPFKAVGRPRLTQELRDAIIRIGSENLLWGYKRIVGELKKLGLYAGANSVKRILDEAGIHPSPEKRKKKPALPWTTFVRAHIESMVACDFFTKTVLTTRGPLTAYVLIFIHLGSRRVFCSSATYAPDSAWVTQQARNTLMWCAEHPNTPKLQAVLRNLMRVLSAASVVQPDRNRALFLIKNAPIPAFRHKTILQLVAEGRTEDAVDYLESVSSGFVG